MFIHDDLMRIRQKEILEEAKRYRLVSISRPSPVSRKHLYSGAMIWIGKTLMIIGTWLTKRFEEENIISSSGVADNQIHGIN